MGDLECIQLTNHTEEILSDRSFHKIYFKTKDKELVIRFFTVTLLGKQQLFPGTQKIANPFCMLPVTSPTLLVFLFIFLNILLLFIQSET